MFKIGDNVTWVSQAFGYKKAKNGVVVGIVPAGKIISGRWDSGARQYLAIDYRRTHFVMMFDGGRREHESYLVMVCGGKTAAARPKLYWPRVSQLKKMEEVK